MSGHDAGKPSDDVEASRASTVQLELQSRPESVAIVRAMLAGTSEQLDFGAELLADLKTAVSEACNNVVMHAYGERVGPMRVRLQATEASVQVIVADRGGGIDEAQLDLEPAGVGIPVMRALTADARFVSVPGSGTEVQLLFVAGGHPERWMSGEHPEPDGRPDGVQGDILVTVSPVSLLSGILGRIAGCVAAEAHFSIDRYADLYLVSDGLAAHARDHASGGAVTAALAARPREIDLVVGPLQVGSAETLAPISPGPSSPLLSLLIDETTIGAASGSETLMLMLADRHSAS